LPMILRLLPTNALARVTYIKASVVQYRRCCYSALRRLSAKSIKQRLRDFVGSQLWSGTYRCHSSCQHRNRMNCRKLGRLWRQFYYHALLLCCLTARLSRDCSYTKMPLSTCLVGGQVYLHVSITSDPWLACSCLRCIRTPI
jgi:hypothetical protein